MKLETILTGLTVLRDKLHTNHLWNDPVGLSETMLKLATYNSYLADNIAALHKDASEQSLLAFMKYRDEFGVTEAEKRAKQDSLDTRQNYENVKNIYSATDKLITVIQSRLRVIEQQMRSE